MEKFAIYLFEKAKLRNIFFTIFAITMVVGATIVFLTVGFDHYIQLMGLTLLSALFGGLFVSMLGMSRSASDFFKDANELEAFIREEGDKDTALEMLYNLKNKSFHRETGNRLRELAKMMEIKYNVTILKR